MYKINLLPPELQKDISIDIKKLVKRVSISLVVLFVLLSYSIFIFSCYLTKREIARTEKYLNELRPTVQVVEDLKKERQGNEQTIQKFTALMNKRLTWSFVLDDFNRNLPVDVWLGKIELSFVDPQAEAKASSQAGGQTNAQAQNQSGTQSGAGVKKERKTASKDNNVKSKDLSLPEPNTLVIDGYSLSVSSIGVFINNLNKLPYFTKVTLDGIVEDEENKVLDFTITAAIKEGGQ